MLRLGPALLILSAGCGRIAFEGVSGGTGSADAQLDGPHDPPPAFCTAAEIPADAVASLCMDFDSAERAVIPDETELVPDRLFNRGDATFTEMRIVSDAIATNPAFSYQPVAGIPSCGTPGCCYADLFLAFGDDTFTDHVHVEYEHYIAAVPEQAWIGGLFWGERNMPYKLDVVEPALGLGRWIHVSIDGDVGSQQPLTIRIDGVERPHTSGLQDHSNGVETTIGTFCWDAPGAGYIDNILFWGR